MSSTRALAQWLAKERSDDTLIAWQGEQQWTLAQLRHDVAYLCTQLQQRDGKRWALCLENSYLFLVALLATLHAGKIPVLTGTSQPERASAQCGALDGVLTEQPAVGHAGLVVSSGQTCRQPLPPVPAQAAIELYTSGSTGDARRIIKPVALLDAEAALAASRLAGRLAHCRVVASVTPLHLYGLTFRIMLPMALDLPFHAPLLSFPEQLSAIPDDACYALISSPAFLKRLDTQLKPPPLALILSAGGAFSWTAVKKTQAWCGIWTDEIYGSTETGVLAWRQRVDNDSAWLLFPGITLKAEDDRWRVLSPLIATDDGLLLEDELTFVDNGFRLAGRRDRVVKIEEKRVSLGEIERRLGELDGVCDAAVIALNRHGRQSTAALLVLTPERRAEWQTQPGKMQRQWRQQLQRWLEPIALPRYWRVVDAIPVNTMNKRVTAQLQEFFNDAP